jgi:hypothetical protein
MSSDMNRRAILAGAAALPASTLPALGADDALIAIGEKMKPLVRPYFEASSKHEELSQQVDELVMSREDSGMTLIEREGLWESARQKTVGHNEAYERMCDRTHQIWPLAEAALGLRATSMAGFGVLAIAALVVDGRADVPEGQTVLAELARAAGFDVPA